MAILCKLFGHKYGDRKTSPKPLYRGTYGAADGAKKESAEIYGVLTGCKRCNHVLYGERLNNTITWIHDGGTVLSIEELNDPEGGR